MCRQEQIAIGQGRRHRTGKWLEFIVRRTRVSQTSNWRAAHPGHRILEHVGGSLSQPSDAMITTAPRSPLPWGGTSKAAMLRPMNVPP